MQGSKIYNVKGPKTSTDFFCLNRPNWGECFISNPILIWVLAGSCQTIALLSASCWTCWGGSISKFAKGFEDLLAELWVIPDCARKMTYFHPSSKHIAHKKRLIDTCCIYSLIQYKLNLGFTSNYIHLPSVVCLLQCSAAHKGHQVGGWWLQFEDIYIHLLFCSSLLKTQHLLWVSYLMVKVCHKGGVRHWSSFNDMKGFVTAATMAIWSCPLSFGSTSTRRGFVILTSSRLGADSSHPCAFLGEVSSQSSIVDLLHVLLDFSFGMLQKVSLTLREKIGKNQGKRAEQQGEMCTGGRCEREQKRWATS